MSTLDTEHEIIKAFFQTDSASEIINSLNFMVESLFRRLHPEPLLRSRFVCYKQDVPPELHLQD